MAKPTQTNISGLEKQLLRQYAKSAPLSLVRFKAQAVLLASNYLHLKVYAPGADPSTAAPIYQATGSMTSNTNVKIH